jgi:hypothetical protein
MTAAPEHSPMSPAGSGSVIVASGRPPTTLTVGQGESLTAGVGGGNTAAGDPRGDTHIGGVPFGEGEVRPVFVDVTGRRRVRVLVALSVLIVLFGALLAAVLAGVLPAPASTPPYAVGG